MSDVWETAKSMENEGKEFYEKLAAESTLPGVSKIFSFLAKQEQKHFDYFDLLSKGAPAGDAADEDPIAKVKAIFAEVEKPAADFVPEDETVGAYEKGLSLEVKSIEYYEKILNGSDSDYAKVALKAIIEEEEKHKKILSAIIDFVKRPFEWLENAEFNHLETY